MGKQGPCHHCGVTSTPLWRNGPADKPVLCNACGSRWRTKGSLANYTPMHRQDDHDHGEHRVSKLRPPTSKAKAQKGKKMANHTIVENGPFSGQNFQRLVDADSSNRSSSGSAVSYSQSCTPYDAADASEMTGSAHSHAWESLVPSKKRSCINRPKASPVAKLAKDLNSIMHEEHLYYSEEDLLYHNETPLGSIEIGSGSVLLRDLYSKSEASSIPGENKSHITSESYTESDSFVVHSGNNEASNLNAATERPKRSRLQIEDIGRRDTLHFENPHILETTNLPLVSVDLEDVISYKNFVKYLSKEEQQQLLKLLPPTDSSTPPESLRSMFSSVEFANAINSYQKLLREGILDPSFSIDEEWNAVKRLALTDLTKCNWIECYKQRKETLTKETEEGESINGSKGIAKPDMQPLKRPRDTHFQSCAELNITWRSRKSTGTWGFDDVSSLIPPDNYFDQNLLLDIPFHARHPEAELLCQPSQLSSLTRSSTSMSRVADGEGASGNNCPSSVKF